jgi:peptidoglycan/xylan/chitin deacetylase (PgdA/CDA1 family)
MVARALCLTGLTPLLLRSARWKGAIVLSYHRIGDGSLSDVSRPLWTATDVLDEQLRFMKQWFEIVEPEHLDDDLRAGHGRRVVVTFDDGYRDLYERAYPVLEANGVRATMFLCSGFIDGVAEAWWDEIAWMLRRSQRSVIPAGPWSRRPLALAQPAVEPAIDQITRRYWDLPPDQAGRFLAELAIATGAGRRPADAVRSDWITWDMAREMQAAGHHIGAHTVTHPVLSRLSAERQQEEIVGSVERIAAELGRRPRWLAYPVGVQGAFTAQTRDVARAAGIELAFSNYGGRVTGTNFVPFDVRRVSAETLRVPAVFSSTLALPAVFCRVPG